VLNHRNNDSEALYHKALCSFQLGDTIGSGVLCDSSLSISSYNAFAHNLKGQIKSALGKHYEAIFSYNKAISMNPGQIQFIYNRAIAYVVVKNWNPALLDLNKTIAAAPKFGEAYYKRALCYFELDKKEEALIDLKEAEKLGYKPASEELSRNLAL
jgi:tetratricopeptide (TPR) repeat protein